MQYKYITAEEAKLLWEAGVGVHNRYRNSDKDSPWGNEWSTWTTIKDWDLEDWAYMELCWDDEFRVEVE